MAKELKLPKSEGDKRQPKDEPKQASSNPSDALSEANVRTTFGTPNEDK